MGTSTARPRSSGFRFGHRRQPALRIPFGETHDLAELLKKQDKVHIHTVDGIGIDVEKTARTKIGSDTIAGLRFTVRLLGMQVEGRHGACQRYLTAWDSINPKRDGLRWRFAFDEDRDLIFRDGHVFVQFVI